MQYEKNTPEKENSDEESLKEKDERFKRILEEALELPSHIAIMRGLRESKKRRRASQKRKR